MLTVTGATDQNDQPLPFNSEVLMDRSNPIKVKVMKDGQPVADAVVYELRPQVA